MNYTKKDVIKRIADLTHYEEELVTEVLDAFFKVVKDYLKRKHTVELRGFTIFYAKPRRKNKVDNLGRGLSNETRFDLSAKQLSKPLFVEEADNE